MPMSLPIFSFMERSCKTHDLCNVTCEFKATSKCEGMTIRKYYVAFINAKRNSGKYICRSCSSYLKFGGRNNPNCKYPTLDDNFFSTVDTEEKAYLLGWIASDGHIRHDRIQIAIHKKDIKCLETLRDIICKELPVITLNTRPDMVSLTFSSAKISQDVQSHLSLAFDKKGPHKKSSTVRLPQLGSKKLTRAFIRGYFDGDGCVSIIGDFTRIQASITSDSILMLEDLKAFVEDNIDVKSCMFKNKIIWCADSALFFLNLIYKGSTLHLERKYRKYLECIERRMKVELVFGSR